jgi:hypothetical protein
MLQSERQQAAALLPAARSARQLPFYVEPLAEEALLSWLLRLATSLGVSLRVLTQEAFGIKDRPGDSPWWRRPNPWFLQRISHKTGLGIERLNRMTFRSWMSEYREDEDCERFGGRHYAPSAPESRALRLAVCSQCLAEDREPYLRLWWMIGWAAVCPRHRTILTDRCSWCRNKVRTPRSSGLIEFAPGLCASCGQSLEDDICWLANPAAVQMQDLLLSAKRYGSVEFDGIGRLSWSEILALLDYTIGAYWKDLSDEEQEQVRAEHAMSHLAPSIVDSAYGRRYGSLLLITWFLEGWPEGDGPKVARRLLELGLKEKKDRSYRHLGISWGNPDRLHPLAIRPDDRARLRGLL